MATRLTFLLDARDGASRVLDRIGDNANRLGRRMLTASINGEAAMNRFGRTTTDRMAAMQRDTGLGAKAVEHFKGALISLAPAAIPMLASIAPIAPAVGAATVATGAYAAALGPQISAMSKATEAEKKYTEEVKKSGRTSEAAVAAQVEYQRVVADLPPETRRAAAALSVLRDGYDDWSDSLAADTLPPVTKSFAILNGLLPKTSSLVKGTGRELDRTMTILAGGMESPGLDRLNTRFEQFATGTLRKVNNGLVSLMRNSDGKVGRGLSEFMAYAEANGPAAADTAQNIAQALLNLLEAGADVGVGMLDVVNVLTRLVSSVPPEAIATFLQLAFAIKAVQLAALGMAAARTAVAGFATSLVAMRVAAAAAPGRLAGVTAAIGTMSRGAKLAAAGTGIGLLVIALMELEQMGQEAPPDVDKMTSALGRFADSGRVAGEMARVFGKDLSGLLASLSVMAGSGVNADEFFRRLDKNPVGIKDAKKDLELLDKSLAGLVANGKADLAAAGLARIKEQMAAAGHSSTGLNAKLTEYKEALANAAFEEQLAAQAMGLFGQQALAVQTKLDAQKASADGLAQSINALSNAALMARGGIRGMEAAIDAASAALKTNGQTLDENTEKGRNNNQALDDIANATIKAAESARQSGASWSTVNGIYDRGRNALIRSADAMGLNRNEAKALADQILRTPNKTARLKGNLEDLQAKLNSAKSQLKTVPDSRRAKLLAEISDLRNKVAEARGKLNAFNGATATAYITVQTRYATPTPGPYAGKYQFPAKKAGGGPIDGPGTGTSDSVPIWASRGEFMIKASSAAKYGPAFLNALNEGRLDLGGGGGDFSGMAGAGAEAGRGLSAGLHASATGVDSAARVMAAAVTTGVRAELEIASPSKKMKALMKDVGTGLIVGMTGEKSKISATAKDLVADIWAAWAGVKTTKDSALVARVTKDTKKLQTLASARDKLAAKIKEANEYRAGLRTNAQQAAGLSNLGLQEDEVTAGSIQAGLNQKLAKINQFTRYIAGLAKRGLSRTLLRQVIDMGPDAGYAYASALSGMGTAALRGVNTTQGKLDTAANNLSGLGADLMFDSGKNSAKGYLRGLDSQQDAIEAQMVKIAKGMQKALRKALGIASPARKLIPDGVNSARGVAVGLVEGLPYIDRAMGAVAGRMAGMRPAVGRAALGRAGGSSGGGINVNVTFTGLVTDPIATAKQIQKVLADYALATGQPVVLGVSG
ncbi:hypothetical protein IFE09_11380 [Streptomyces microflavus]|nr:hypothetical protein [Streptomyces microflavus]QQZ54157.1 hypothetical protein IFE09_11380 [Streptomyces microflavus]